jgi:hypothetical protein
LFVPYSSHHDHITAQRSGVLVPGGYSHMEDSAIFSIHSLSDPRDKETRRDLSVKLRARKMQISASACTDSTDSPFLHKARGGGVLPDSDHPLSAFPNYCSRPGNRNRRLTMTLRPSTAAGTYIVVQIVGYGKVMLRESHHRP